MAGVSWVTPVEIPSLAPMVDCWKGYVPSLQVPFGPSRKVVEVWEWSVSLALLAMGNGAGRSLGSPSSLTQNSVNDTSRSFRCRLESGRLQSGSGHSFGSHWGKSCRRKTGHRTDGTNTSRVAPSWADM